MLRTAPRAMPKKAPTGTYISRDFPYWCFALQTPVADRICSVQHVEPAFDAKAEAALRRKIDWMIVPTVALLYMFCFIDRANIGRSTLTHFFIYPVSIWLI